MDKAINGILYSTFLLTLGVMSGCNLSKKEEPFQVDTTKYLHSIGYIDSSEVQLNKGFKVCDEERIYQYYNPKEASYSKGKNGLRNFILQHYKNEGYQDSGYLTIRFVINCEGQAGRYIIHENNLELVPTKLNPKMVAQLFDLTTQLKTWNPNIIFDKPSDSYVFLTYRIEDGEIMEILP